MRPEFDYLGQVPPPRFTVPDRPGFALVRLPRMSSLALIGQPPEDRKARFDGFPGFPPEIDPTCCIEAFASIDAGLERPTTLGARTYLLKRSHVGHDAQVGADCDIATGAIIGGYAEIADSVKVGLNAVVLPFRKVGHGSIIGAGAVVTKDVPAGEVWAGNPARKLRDVHDRTVPFSERAEASAA